MNNKPTRRTHVRRNRHPRPSPNADRQERTRDERVLSALPYRKGHLTDQELWLFDELRGPLTSAEVDELKQVADTLRKPSKRLRALDLVRYWGAPLSPDQRTMLPWFAGLPWHRSIPDAPLHPVELAAHLLCKGEAPDFLFEPFAHPQRYYPHVAWELCRLLSVVASGGGLMALREIEPFWAWVPESIFTRFLESAPGGPILASLVGVFVESWGGPEWLPSQAMEWKKIRSLQFGFSQTLRVAHELCLHPVSPSEAREIAKAQFGAMDSISTIFGRAVELTIPGVVPASLEGWRCRELRSPHEFEALRLEYRFKEAQEGATSYWTLRNGPRLITIRVDVGTMVARNWDFSRELDPEWDGVLALWAEANGLTAFIPKRRRR